MKERARRFDGSSLSRRSLEEFSLDTQLMDMTEQTLGGGGNQSIAVDSRTLFVERVTSLSQRRDRNHQGRDGELLDDVNDD
jgi:hypothetical protein